MLLGGDTVVHSLVRGGDTTSTRESGAVGDRTGVPPPPSLPDHLRRRLGGDVMANHIDHMQSEIKAVVHVFHHHIWAGTAESASKY